MILSRRYVLPIVLAVSLSAQSMNAMMMDSEGITTDHGYITWKQLISMPAQVRMLQFLYVGSIAAVAGVYAYYKMQESQGVAESQSQETEPVK